MKPDDIPADQLPPDDAELEAAAQRAERLQSFGNSLSGRRKEAIEARTASRMERRWLDDLDAYHGRDQFTKRYDMMDAVTGEASQVTQRTQEQKPTRSTVFVQITRSKTNAAEARLADMLFPVDDRNWGIEPTPVPQLAAEAKDDQTVITLSGQPAMLDDPQAPGGQRPATASDLAQHVIAEANKRCEAMQKEMDDQLTECQYNGVGRQIIHDAAMLGVGIIKGPFTTTRTKKAWTPLRAPDGQEVQVLRIVRDLTPASERVDPWHFFPEKDCGENIHECSGVWELKYVTARYVKKLATMASQGYMPEQIKLVLEEGPKHSYKDVGMNSTHDAQKRLQGGYLPSDGTLFEYWEWNGDCEREELEAAGVEVDGQELTSVRGSVVMINDLVIKADLNPLDTGDYPYDVFVWEKCDGAWAGFGIPYLMRYAQKVVNAAWRVMMDNAGQTGGPQVVAKRGAIEPSDGRWEISGRKIWWLDDDEEDARKAFAVFEIANHQEEYERIIMLALKFADEETNLPMLAQGEKGTAPDTVGGMQILFNSANVVLRRLVKQWDDSITVPHLDRYYDYNMQYNKKSDIKGDFQIKAKGSSVLLVRDQQGQAMIKMGELAKDPVYGIYVDPKKVFVAIVQSMHLTTDMVMRSDAEIDELKKKLESKQPQPSPDAQVRAAATVKVAEIGAEGRLAEVHAKQGDTEQERQHELLLAAIDGDARMRELIEARGMNLDKVKASLAKTAIEQATHKDLFAREAALKRETGSGVPL